MTTTRLVSPLSLAKGALKDYRQGWKRLIWIVAIVAVPVQLIIASYTSAGTADFDSNAYRYAAILAMNVALLWAIVLFNRDGQVPKAADAYYGGSALLIRFFIIIMLLSLMLIPLFIGLALYSAGASALNTPGTTPEVLIIVFVSLLIALPSLYMLIRYALAFVVSADADLYPVAALRAARSLTIGRFWRVTARYVALIGFMILIAIPAALVDFLLVRAGQPVLGQFIFGLFTTLIFLPLFNLYLLRLYRDLQIVKAPFKPKKSETSESDVI